MTGVTTDHVYGVTALLYDLWLYLSEDFVMQKRKMEAVYAVAVER